MASVQVSVIIPTHNRGALVADAIRSVCAQTHRDWELIVVDDGSTDDTEAVVRGLANGRIRYLRQDNRGVSAARNAGIEAARGALIAFLDSDDRWLPGKLDAQCGFLDGYPHISICQTEEIWIRHGIRVNPRRRHAKPSGWIFRECLPLCVVSPSAVMVRRNVFSAIGLFDETLPACEDYDLWLRASLHFEIVTLPEALTVKVGGHADQLSRGWGLDRWRIAALEKILGNPALSYEHRSLVEGEIARRAAIVAEGARKRGNVMLCEEYMRRSRPAIKSGRPQSPLRRTGE